MTASACQRPQAGTALAEASCQFAISRWRICNRAVASGLSSAPKSKKEEEAAKPGQPVAQSAFLEVSPPVTPSRESPVTASSAAFIRPSQELSRFAEHTLRQFVARRKSNSEPHCAETVDDESSLWKTEEI